LLAGKILIKQENCTGCRSCEMACSYHLTRAFQPSASRIQVIWDSEQGEMHLQKGECDLCRGEKEPLCVKYCAPKALVYQGERD